MATQVPINAAGLVIHTAVHEARPDAACVIHTHTRAGVAVSCLEEGLLPLNQTALMFYGHVAYHEFEGIALDWDERARLVADLGTMQRHDPAQPRPADRGPLLWARHSRWMYNLEMSCRIQLDVLSSGRPIHYPSDAVKHHTAEQFAADPDDVATLEWEALRRLADYAYPGGGLR